MNDWKPLANVLLDKSVDEGARDDAAMDLSYHRNRDVLDLLIAVAQNAEEDEMILASCGESIGEIIVALGLPHSLAGNLYGSAKFEARCRLGNPAV